MPDLSPPHRCQGTKKNGDPCASPATEDGFCFWHSDSVPASVKTDAARAGGLAHRQDILPDLEEIALKHPKDAKKLLSRMVRHVLGGTLTTSRANSAGFLLRVLAELEAITRRRADLRAEVTVNIVRFDNSRELPEGNASEAPPSPRVVVSVPLGGIAHEQSTYPQPLPLSGGDANG